MIDNAKDSKNVTCTGTRTSGTRGYTLEIKPNYEREAELCHKRINEMYAELSRKNSIIFYQWMILLLVFAIGVWVGCGR